MAHIRDSAALCSICGFDAPQLKDGCFACNQLNLWKETRTNQIAEFLQGTDKRIIDFIVKNNYEFDPIVSKLFNCMINKEPGIGLYIYGAPGSGKSVLAAAILIYATCFDKFTRTSHFRTRKQFVNSHTLLKEIKHEFNTNQAIVLDKILTIPFLVLDDFGSERVSDFTFEIMHDIVCTRYGAMLPTIYTSNYPLKKIEKKYDDQRMTSRISHCCVQVPINKDRRR